MVEIDRGAIFEPRDDGFRDAVGGAVERHARAFVRHLRVARCDQEDRSGRDR